MSSPVQGEAAGWLYAAQVMHRRRVAPFYRFTYRLFYLLVDVDRIDELAAGLHGFSRNRFNLLALHDADYGDRKRGASLRSWAERHLAQAGIDLQGGRIRLLTLPRLLGFAFNPINLWYCEHASGELRAVIAEVNNTFGETHAYLLPVASAADAAAYSLRQGKDKCFHVSPFFDLVGRYQFELDEPAERLRVVIHESREGTPILDAKLSGSRIALCDRNLVLQVLRMPWMTLKVVAGIHWQALKIWLRGGRYHRKPPPPSAEMT